MIRKKLFNKPFDLGHSIMYNEYPDLYTRTIGVPGIFVKKSNRRVHLKNGITGEMDSAYVADPDYVELFERAAVALGHQSTPVDDDKLGMIGNYDIQLVKDEELPTLIAIASHLDKEKSKNELQRTPSDITRIYFLNLDEENITERLSNVSEIIDNNLQLSMEDALNLGVIVLYSPRKRAREITKSVINLYLKIVDDLDDKMEYTLFSVITVMIDAYFDDEKEYRRLRDMMDENTSVKSKDAFASHECTIESLKFAKEDLAEVKGDLAEAKDKIAMLEAENARLIDELNGKEDTF